MGRYTDADLSLCRLVRKACLALEIIELPAIEFVDALATAVRLLSASMQRRRKQRGRKHGRGWLVLSYGQCRHFHMADG